MSYWNGYISSKNYHLVGILEDKLDNMCGGLGTRKIKLFLNKKVKAGDEMAYVLRQRLEIEMDNINAKKYGYSYKDHYYDLKHKLIEDLLSHLIKNNPCEISYGFSRSDVSDTDYIVYFEHPSWGQISFHTDLNSNTPIFVPHFKGNWDGLVNSTMGKLEKAIVNEYGNELNEKYPDEIARYEENMRIEKERKKRKDEKDYLASFVVAFVNFSTLFDDDKAEVRETLDKAFKVIKGKTKFSFSLRCAIYVISTKKNGFESFDISKINNSFFKSRSSNWSRAFKKRLVKRALMLIDEYPEELGRYKEYIMVGSNYPEIKDVFDESKTLDDFPLVLTKNQKKRLKRKMNEMEEKNIVESL